MTASLSIPLAAHAADNVPATKAVATKTVAATQLPTMIVTASRTRTQADDSVSDVVVLGPVELERYDNHSLPEVLQRAAGIDFDSNGGIGQNAGLHIRGSKSGHVLLLVDGVRYGSATAGLATWTTLPMSSIERIEIIKGPASSLYGSDAVGGVVQIFTRKGSKGVHHYASFGVGNARQRKFDAGVTGADGPLRYSVNIARQAKSEVSATNAKSPFSFNPDRDPFQSDSIDAALDYRLSQKWSVNAHVLNSAGVVHFDDGAGDVDTRSETGAGIYSVGVNGLLTPDWKTQILVGQSNDLFTQIASNSAFTKIPSRFNTTQSQYLWQNQIVTPIGLMLAGAERLTQSIDSSTAYTVTSRTIDGVFVGLNDEQGPHAWQVNLRSDSNSQFGQSTTGFAGYGYALTPAWRVQTSYGTSFKAPSFNDLYFPGFSNPNLAPETGRSYDAGVVWKRGKQNAKLMYFSNEVKDLIVFTNIPNNIAKAKTTGWTAEYGVTQGGLSASVSAQLIDAKDATTDKELIRVAREQYRASLDYRIQKWLVGASVLNSGRRFDNAANTTLLDGFTTADVSVAYFITPSWSLRAQVDNVADVEYSTSLGYNQPRRNIFLSMRWMQR